MGYVYVLLNVNETGDETFKIGVTKNNPYNRIKQLSTGNPNKITLLTHYESDNYKKIEQWLHRMYSSKKTLADNEWFNLSNDDILSFISECKKIDETINLLKENNPFYK